MDSQNISSPTIPQTQPTEPVISPPRQNLLLTTIAIIVLLILVIGVGAYYLGTKQTKDHSNIVPTIIPTVLQPTQSATVPDETANWKTYANTKNAYSIKYPPEFYIKSEGEFYLKQNTVPAGQYISIMVLNNPEKLSFSDWAKIKNADTGYGIYFPTTELKITQKKINGINWLNFKESQAPPGFPPSGDIYWATLKENKVYLIGLLNLDYKLYSPKIESMLATFKFLDQNQTKYVCPENGWVDCMPILTLEKQKLCSQEAIAWYKVNCPNYKGIAL